MYYAPLAERVDASDLGSDILGCEGSSPLGGTKIFQQLYKYVLQ